MPTRAGLILTVVLCGVSVLVSLPVRGGMLFEPPDLGDAMPAVFLLGVHPLPPEPAAEEVELYLCQIAEATAALVRDPRRDDPQTALLDALAGTHLDALVQAHERYPELRYYLEPIIHREVALRGGPDADRLSVITLRDGADDQAAWSYVTDIARATVGQRRVSANDPQLGMLEALAEEHMRVLIDVVALPELRFYALHAIRRNAINKHKDTLIAALPDQPRLIGIIRQQGWTADARDQLVFGLERGVSYMPRTWVQAVAELRDPATYDALALHLARSRCGRVYHQLMCDLPGIDLGDAVAVAWGQVERSPDHARELREVSGIAITYGHRGALEHLVSLLPTADAAGTDRDGALRQLVLDHIEFAGTNDEIRGWYDTHRDRLRFSEGDRRFYVAGMLQ